jgi:hypothetical protein
MFTRASFVNIKIRGKINHAVILFLSNCINTPSSLLVLHLVWPVVKAKAIPVTGQGVP